MLSREGDNEDDVSFSTRHGLDATQTCPRSFTPEAFAFALRSLCYMEGSEKFITT